MSRDRRRAVLPEPLGADVERELARLGRRTAGQGDMASLTAIWPSAVGEVVSRNAWPARFTRDGTLVVHAASSAWAFELGQLATEVLERLGDQAPPAIRFVVGALPEWGPEAVEEVQRVPPPPDPAARALGAEIARPIDDPGLREAVAKAVAASLARGSGDTGTAAPSDTLQQM